MFSQTLSYPSKNIKCRNFAVAKSLIIDTAHIHNIDFEDWEFYKLTREALDRFDGVTEGMSKEDFLKELDSW